MTAINAYGRGARGYLLCDSAGYDVDGIVRAFYAKAVPVPGLRMVVAARGHQGAPAALAADIGRAIDSFDEFVAGGQEFLTDWYEISADELARSGEPHVDIVVVGWSDDRAVAEAFAMSSHDHRPLGEAPFTLTRHDYILAPTLPAGQVQAIATLHSDPVRRLTAVIDAQRTLRVPLGTDASADLHYIVGGEAVLTEVSRTGVTQRVIRTWGDSIGERITPAPSTTMSRAGFAVDVPMNRKARKAAQAEARRKSAA